MCDDNYAKYSCADKHEKRGEERARVRDVRLCRNAQDTGQTCDASNRGRAHDWQDDDDSQECPECRGETPPETP
jgi:hypothetical protein